jgi:hypothetical protein
VQTNVNIYYSSNSVLHISLISSAYEKIKCRCEAISNPADARFSNTNRSKPEINRANKIGDSGQPYLIPSEVQKGDDKSVFPLITTDPWSRARYIKR